MTSLTENVVNRVRKLTKPSNFAQAMQPIFEATSNSMFAIEDRFGEKIHDDGLIVVSVDNLGYPDELEVSVSDNGIGLDKDRFDAFCVVDTEYKMERGGKGVGRLFWLDAFDEISVSSAFLGEKGGVRNRSFRFVLREEEQIEDLSIVRRDIGTTVEFTGLRQQDYINNFPKRSELV